MNQHSVPWGYSANDRGERFWSVNADGRYTVGFYAPTVRMSESDVHFQIRSSEWKPMSASEALFSPFLPEPGPINPSQSDGERYNNQLKMFSKALAERAPLRKEVMVYSQLVHLQNKDLANELNMFSYVKRVASFLDEAGKRDEYIPTGQPVKTLAEAGFFSQSSQKSMFGPRAPRLICFACGFETTDMRQNRIDDHLRHEESGCSMKLGYRLRQEIQKQMMQDPLKVFGPGSPNVTNYELNQEVASRENDDQDEEWQDITDQNDGNDDDVRSQALQIKEHERNMEEEIMRGWVIEEDEDIS